MWKYSKDYRDNDYKYLDFKDRYKVKDKSVSEYCKEILDFYKEEVLKNQKEIDELDKDVDRLKKIKNGVPQEKPLTKKESISMEIDDLISALESITTDDLSIEIIKKLKLKIEELKNTEVFIL